MTKQLVINEVIYALYEFDEKMPDTIFLKLLINIVPNNVLQSEEEIISIIKLIEQKENIKYDAYLNV